MVEGRGRRGLRGEPLLYNSRRGPNSIFCRGCAGGVPVMAYSPIEQASCWRTAAGRFRQAPWHDARAAALAWLLSAEGVIVIENWPPRAPEGKSWRARDQLTAAQHAELTSCSRHPTGRSRREML
jgi:hypothetical protein